MTARFATMTDREEVIAICTHPEVRKWTACDGAPAFDADRWLKNGMVVLLEGACFLANPIAERMYACHTHVLPGFRGSKALQAAGEALHLAFTCSDAETFMTMVPENNPPAAWLARTMGFRQVFEQPDKWRQGGKTWALRHYRLDIDDWIVRNAALQAIGEDFHRRLAALDIDTHAADPLHDRYVGAAATMIANDRIGKAIDVYSRWSRIAGYAALGVVSRDPPVIDAHDFLIHVDGNQMRVTNKEAEHA